MRLRNFLCGVALAGLLAAASVTRADTIHVFDDGSSGPITWSYYVTMDSAGVIDSSKGAMFASIQSFPGLVSVAFLQDAGNSPVLTGLSETTSTAGGNATVNFTDVTPIAYNAGAADKLSNGDEILGKLVVTTSLATTLTAPDQWISQDYNPAGNNGAGALDGGFSSVDAPTALPAPASLWGGAGLLGLMGIFGIRRRRLMA